MAVIGLSSSAYAAHKGEPKELYVPLIYFSLMEALQAYTYIVIDQCGNPANQIATLLGYLHITFQPFFINAASMYFIPKKISERIAAPVYTLCFISSIFMIIQVYPFEWAGNCAIGRPLCEATLCSVSGNWHIAWDVPANGIGNYFYELGFRPLSSGYVTYVLVAFLLPLLYGCWRFTVYHYMMGPFIANILTANMNERPAVWCLLSIALLLIVVKTPVRQYLFVKNYPFIKSKKNNKKRKI